MPSYSQNGYLAGDRSVIVTMTVPGTDVRIPVRKGPCGDLLMWAAARWHREVEPLVEGTCWGYADRTIRGSSTELSNHASGTACDFNAPKHPLGTDPSANFTPAQIAAINRIVADAAPALRWGGSYGDPAHGGVAGSRPDGMHLEINTTEGVVGQVLARVQQTGDKGVFTNDDRALLTGVYHQMSGSPKVGEWPGWPSWVKPEEHLTLLDFLRRNEQDMAALRMELAEDRQDMLNAIGSLQSELAALRAQITNSRS